MALAARQAEYERLNGKYMKDGEKLLRRKDYAQASEKFWGAATEIVKAVAARRGIGLGAHRSILEFVERLEDEHPEWSLMDAMAHAERLHINFYEDHLPEKSVRRSVEAVKEFVENLRGLL